MENQVVSLSIHDATITLDIPTFLIKKLKKLDIRFSSDMYDVACIHIHPLNDWYVRFCVEDNHVVIENTVVKVDQVLFRLFVEIEDLLMRQMLYKNSSRIALHGGGIVSNGKAILVLQEKGAGKSTLIAKLAQNKTHRYLSDDLLITNGKTVLGVPLPMRLRQLKVQGLDLMGSMTESGLDIDNRIRHFYMPTIEAETSEIPVSAILIPHYDPQSSNYIIKAKGNEKARIIINQIKRYPNMEQMYKNLLLLSNSINVYHLHYKDFSVLDSHFIRD